MPRTIFYFASFRRIAVAALFGVGLLTGGFGSAVAASVTVVALGTSNTYGFGVARNETYPAILQEQLRKRGINVRVINAGRNSDTAKGMLGRLNASVPAGTRLVLLEIYPKNEMRGGVAGETSENVAAIKNKLQARGIPTLDVSDTMVATIFSRAPTLPNQHLAPAGYEIFVSRIVSQVASALSR
jgi:acyl-CoA thioesterase-1